MTSRAVALVAAVCALHCTDRGGPDPRPAPPRRVVARLVAVSGTAKVIPAGAAEVRPAREGMELAVGDVVRTWARSSAVIEFRRDGFRLVVHPDSDTKILEDEAEVAGVIDFRGSATDPTTIKHRDRTVQGVPNEPRDGTVQGTGPETTLQIRDGAAALNTQGQRVVVGKNQQVVVDDKGVAGPVTKLPAPPSLLAPAPGGVLAVPDPARAPVAFAWTAVPGATGYHVRVHTDAIGVAPILDQRVEGGATTLVADPLPAGTYYWEVSTILRDKEGMASRIAAFTIRRAAAPSGPLLVVDRIQVKASTVYVEGRTDEGARLTINGEGVGVDAAGRFREHILRPASRRLVLRAVTADGVTEKSVPLSENP